MYRNFFAALPPVLLFFGPNKALADGNLANVNHIMNRDAGESFVRQLLWRTRLCAQESVSQWKWTLPAERPSMRGWFDLQGRFLR
jgi:hypothetical protein